MSNSLCFASTFCGAKITPSTIEPLEHIHKASLQDPWCGLTNTGWQSLVAGELEASLDDSCVLVLVAQPRVLGERIR